MTVTVTVTVVTVTVVTVTVVSLRRFPHPSNSPMAVPCRSGNKRASAEMMESELAGWCSGMSSEQKTVYEFDLDCRLINRYRAAVLMEIGRSVPNKATTGVA